MKQQNGNTDFHCVPGSVRHGFTLIELLVVIAVIAVLASMLLPALQRGKATAQRIACVSQIKTLGTTWNAYGADQENLPHIRSIRYTAEEDRNNAGKFKGGDTWIHFLFPGKVNKDNLNMTREIYNLMRCPGHSNLYSFGTPNFYITNGSYGMPQLGIGGNLYGSNALWFQGRFRERPLLKYQDVRRPSGQAAFLDSQGSQNVANRLDGNAVKGSYSNDELPNTDGSIQGSLRVTSTAFRHSGTANVIFCDGHAETLKRKDILQTKRYRTMFGRPE